jgi:REP element-mobilizing transposase RayT
MRVRLKRYYGHGDLHFITFSCYRREPRLAAPAARDCFLSILEQVRQKYDFVVAGYVVMPEHVHPLISEPATGSPSLVMQVLKQRRRASSPARRFVFGNYAFTISTYSTDSSGAKSSTTCTAIPCVEDSLNGSLLSLNTKANTSITPELVYITAVLWTR